MRIRTYLAMLLIAVSASIASAAEPTARKPATAWPDVKELPNPFLFTDGSPVRTVEDWARRRIELKNLFQDYMYGHMPPKPEKMTVKRGEPILDQESLVALQDLELKLEQGGKAVTLHVKLALPPDVKEPVPVLIQSGFGGFRRPTPAAAAPVPPGRRFAPFTKRGYAVAECNFQEAAPDNNDRARTGGVYQLFGDKIDCGGLMAWAWCMSRVLDALEKIDSVDAKKAIVTGHSRYGKASLVAGAFDERIALTVPSHSGCGGAAPYRFIYDKNEQLHNIVDRFPYWFRPDFNQFKGHVTRLPVDQHELIALVAPRALMNTEGTLDTWINPQGAQLTHLAAKKVYDFLKSGDKISIRYRPVAHIPNNGDLLDFADHVFFGKPLPAEFSKLPYPEEKNGFHWEAPK